MPATQQIIVMLFNQFCGIAEKFLPDHIDTAKRANLFYFDKAPHEFLPKSKPDINFDMFTLPFPITAVEDPANLIILSDPVEGQFGINLERKFIEVSRIDGSLDNYSNHLIPDELQLNTQVNKQIFEKLSGDIFIAEGVINKIEVQETQWIVSAHVDYYHWVDKNRKSIETYNQNQIDNYTRNATASNAMSALEELMTLYTTERFILETSPVLTQKQLRRLSKGKKIPRSDERAVFTILKPLEIREVMGINPGPSQDRKSPVPHERRAHYRLLRKESGYKEDKIVLVKATWIGVSEKNIGNKHYRVILDR